MIPANIMRFIRVYGAKLQKHFGKLYIISSDRASDEEDMYGKYLTPDSQEERVASIEPCLVRSLSELEDEYLENMIAKAGANLVSAVLDSEQGAPGFLMMRTSKSKLFEELGLFAYKVDKNNRDALSVMMANVAVNDPDSFLSFMEKADLSKNAITFMRGGRKTAAEKAEEIKLFISNFTDNMQVIRHPEDNSEDDVNRANYEVKTVLSSMSSATLEEFMFLVLSTKQIPDDNTIESRFLDLDSAAKKSDVDLIIRPRKKNEKIMNSDGKYHLTFRKGENDPKHIRFPGKVETTIFYTVMVARKTTGAKNIEILDLEKEFIGIYRALYVASYEDAKLAFEGIKDYDVKDENGELIRRYQGRYRNYIPNIRAAIDAALGGSDNPAVYHYDYSYRKGGHFYVDVGHIHLDEQFLSDIERLQDPCERATFV